MQRWLVKFRSHLAWQVGRGAGALTTLANVLFGTLWYDVVLARQKRISQGSVSDAARVVVYLIYPKNGLLESHFRALNHFLEHGYSPIVVSNVSLSDVDRTRLLTSVNRLIERPNYGYDFGGYRDGVLFLRDRLPSLERLALMNDSVWFPVTRTRDWLPAAEALGWDVVGAVSNFFVDPKQVRDCPEVHGAWRYDTRHPKFHYCSFALSFGPAVLRDTQFLRFWDRLKLSDDKIATVHRGEVGLGQWVVRSGHSHGCTLDLSRLDLDLDQLDDSRLREIAENLIIPEDAALRAQKALVLTQSVSAPDERRRLKGFILLATAQTGGAYALLDFAIRHKGHGFVKKSPLWLDAEGARTTLLLLSEMGEHTLLAEALSLLGPRMASDVTRVLSEGVQKG
jgi:hypothetical protein